MKKYGTAVAIAIIGCLILIAFGQTLVSATSENEYYPSLNIKLPNSPPNKPEKPSGPDGTLLQRVRVGKSYTYSTTTTDPDGDDIWYNWSWGDYTYSGWDGPYDSGGTGVSSHIWSETGTYLVKVQAMDSKGAKSDWSDPLEVKVTKPLFNAGIIEVEGESQQGSQQRST